MSNVLGSLDEANLYATGDFEDLPKNISKLMGCKGRRVGQIPADNTVLRFIVYYSTSTLVPSSRGT